LQLKKEEGKGQSMQKAFKDVQNKLLKRFLDEVVFIELKDNHSLNLQNIEVPDKVLLPVYISDLADKIKQDDIEKIPIVAILKGLVYVVGADNKLPFTKFYIDLLKSIDASITLSILQDALRYAEEKQFAHAILYFNAVLNIDPNNIDALYNLGRCFDDFSEKDQRPELKMLAKYCYEACVKLDEHFAFAYFSLGFSHYNDENFQLAENNWMRAFQYDLPETMVEEMVMGLGRVKDKATYEKGYALILDGRVTEGLEFLKSIEEMHDEWWNLLFFIGIGYRMLEQYEDALGYFLKVMNLNTGHIQTMNEIGVCLIALGDYVEAEKYYKEAIRLAPENAELICNLGIVHYYRGDDKTASELFNRAHSLSPDDEVVQMWLEQIQNKLN